MDVEIVIRYPDDRSCTVTVAKPSGEVFYRIVTPCAGIPRSVAEGLQEARRLFAAEPWASNKLHWLLLGSGVVTSRSRDEGSNKGDKAQPSPHFCALEISELWMTAYKPTHGMASWLVGSLGNLGS